MNDNCTMLNLKVAWAHLGHGLMWIRLNGCRGFGLYAVRKDSSAWSFSHRYGYEKGVYIGQWFVGGLRL